MREMELVDPAMYGNQTPVEMFRNSGEMVGEGEAAVPAIWYDVLDSFVDKGPWVPEWFRSVTKLLPGFGTENW